MSNTKPFDWKYLTTNEDGGIISIVLKIIRHLEPKDIQNFGKINQDVRNFILRERVNISKGYKRVTLRFPWNDWNNKSLESIWSRRYFTECLSNTYNVITEYSTTEEHTEVNIIGGTEGVLLSSWELHTSLDSDDTNIDVIIDLRKDANRGFRHFSRKSQRKES